MKSTTDYKIDFRFEFDGKPNVINRKGYESEEQLHEIATDMIEKGWYLKDICKEYDLTVDYEQLISNTFRQGPGHRYLVKLIRDEGLKAHPDFWENEAGRNVRANPALYSNKKVVQKKPKQKTKLDLLFDRLEFLNEVNTAKA